MIKWKRIVGTILCAGMTSILIAGCGSTDGSATKKRIIRVALSQSEEHPEYKGLVKFKDYIESELGDKYEVQLFPNELLGGQTKAIELTQTGAIDFTVAGTPNLEIFADVYEESNSNVASADANKVTWNIDNDNPIQITNTKGLTLPGTGGIGTTLFTFGGIALILIAGVMFIVYTRKQKKQS